jgi:hypothetical protein
MPYYQYDTTAYNSYDRRQAREEAQKYRDYVFKQREARFRKEREAQLRANEREELEYQKGYQQRQQRQLDLKAMKQIIMDPSET